MTTVPIDQIASLTDAADIVRTQTRVGRMLAWRGQDLSLASFFGTAIAIAAAIRMHIAPERASRVARWICYGDAMALGTARAYAARRCTQSLIADLLGWSSDPVMRLCAPVAVNFEVLDPVAAWLCEPLSLAVRTTNLAQLSPSPDDVLIILPGTDLARELLDADDDHPLWRHVDAGGEVIGLSAGGAEVAATTALFELFGDALRQLALLPIPNLERMYAPTAMHAWRLGVRTLRAVPSPVRAQRVRDLLAIAWNQPISDDELRAIGQPHRDESLVRLLWGYWASTTDGRLYRQLGADAETPVNLGRGDVFVATGHGTPLAILAGVLHPTDPVAQRLQWAADVLAAAGPMPRLADAACREVSHVDV